MTFTAWSDDHLSADRRKAGQQVVREYPPVPGLRETIVAAAMRLSLRVLFKSVMKPPTPLALQRGILHILSVAMPPASGVKVEKLMIGAMAAERLTPKGLLQPRHAILYLHGGAFCTGSPRSHRSITTRLAKFAQAQVLAIHYRRVPEHPFPAQIEDAVAGFKHLVRAGFKPEHIAVAGDSAGGTLSLLVTKALEMEGVAGPRCLVMMSPAFNAALNSPSVTERKHLDPMINIEWGRQSFAWYQPQHGHPLSDPMQQDLSTLPPTLVQVGEHEVLYDDSIWITKGCQQYGRQIALEVYLKRWHVFQIHGGLLPGATLALKRQAAFMQKQWAA